MTQGTILHGDYESWITCHYSRVMNHDLAVTPKPVKQLTLFFGGSHGLTNLENLLYLLALT